MPPKHIRTKTLLVRLLPHKHAIMGQYWASIGPILPASDQYWPGTGPCWHVCRVIDKYGSFTLHDQQHMRQK